MPKYAIKHQTVTKPEIELPEGSQVVSVEFWKNIGWQVVWLEPMSVYDRIKNKSS